MGKKTLRVFCLLLALMTALPLDGMAAAKKLRGYDSTQKKSARYQYVQLGTYPYEEDGTKKPVLWLVLSVSKNKALLFSDMILDNRQVVYAKTRRDLDNRRYRRIKDFTESDLYTWMNNDMLNTLFKGDSMKKALVEGEYGKLYPLTDEQMLTKAYGFSDYRYFNHPERQAEATPYTKSIQQYSWSKKITITHQNSTKRDTSPYWVVAFRNPKTMDRNYMMQNQSRQRNEKQALHPGIHRRGRNAQADQNTQADEDAQADQNAQAGRSARGDRSAEENGQAQVNDETDRKSTDR